MDLLHRTLEMWYLHAPDHSVPYEETFKAVDALYREGRLRRLGISNYSSCVRFPSCIQVVDLERVRLRC